MNNRGNKIIVLLAFLISVIAGLILGFLYGPTVDQDHQADPGE